MGSMKEKRKNQAQPPYAAETKDVRFAGTFEVLVPIPARNKPAKVPLQFPTLSAAENWIHSPEGKQHHADILEKAGKKKKTQPPHRAAFWVASGRGFWSC